MRLSIPLLFAGACKGYDVSHRKGKGKQVTVYPLYRRSLISLAPSVVSTYGILPSKRGIYQVVILCPYHQR